MVGLPPWPDQSLAEEEKHTVKLGTLQLESSEGSLALVKLESNEAFPKPWVKLRAARALCKPWVKLRAAGSL